MFIFNCSKGLAVLLFCIFSFLFTAISDANENIDDPLLYDQLLEASSAGNISLVKTLIKQGVGIDAKNSALFQASSRGHTEVVKYLIENGADINVKDDDGRTALNWVESSLGTGTEEYFKMISEATNIE